MFKKNVLLLCALTTAYAPITANVPDTMREEDVVDIPSKGNKKCCRCCSLTVTGSASIGGSLAVGGNLAVAGNEAIAGNVAIGGNEVVTGSVTAASFITTAGGALFNGLRNYAVFANQAALAPVNPTRVPFSAIPLFSNSPNIINAGGIFTLPTGGVFLVMYTVRVQFAANAGPITAVAQLQQGVGGVLANIGQPAVTSNTAITVPFTEAQDQISGYAIVVTAATATNNQIDLLVTLPSGVSAPDATGTDANAEITILQLN